MFEALPDTAAFADAVAMAAAGLKADMVWVMALGLIWGIPLGDV